MELENKKRLEGAIEEIKKFLGTPVHTLFVNSTQRELECIEQSILDIDPLAPNAIGEITHLQGQRRVLLANVTSFEDTVEHLESRIQAILDEEQQIPQNTNEENENIG